MKGIVLYIPFHGAPAQALMQSVRPENVLSLRTLTAAKTGISAGRLLCPAFDKRGFFLGAVNAMAGPGVAVFISSYESESVISRAAHEWNGNSA